ncbi:MAG: cyclic nucleotide-binding domain-containing protein [Chloroflexi bacterium]|nr:cyclic nucleotide-binding domain-containing protein [Chloroflexota bacterium]
MDDNVLVGERKIDFLMRLPLFQGLSIPARDALDKIANEYEFPRGAIIAHQGDVATQLYLVRAGQLESFTVDAQRQYTKQATFSAGDWFDDRWLFEQDVHRATVRARRPGRLILISSAAFLGFINAHPSALNSMYPALSRLAQDAIVHSRFQAYLQAGVRRRVGPTAEQSAAMAAQRQDGQEETAEEQFESFTPDSRRVRRYAKFQLMPEEVVYWDNRRSKKILGFQAAVAGAAALFLLVIPPLLLGTSGFTGTVMLVTGGVLGLIPLLVLAVIWLNWLNCYFLVTNKRLIRYENNVLRFKSQIEKVDIDNVQSVSTEKNGLIASWLDIGTAAITTAAQSHVLYFDFIDRPQEVETAIKRITELKRTIGQSQHRASLRRMVESQFQVPNSVTPVVDLPTGGLAARRGSSISQWFRETFGRVERGGTIIYHRHPIALVRPLLWPLLTGLILLLIDVAVVYFTPDLISLPIVWGTLLILALFDVLWVLWMIEDWRNDTFMITDQYIFDIDRLPLGLNESRKQAELSKIENVRAEQNGILPKMFGFGHVHIETAGADSNLIFENVRQPDKVQNDIFTRRDALRTRLARQEEELKRRDYALMIDLYHQSVQQGRIPAHQPLPAIDDMEEEEEEDERPLVL